MEGSDLLGLYSDDEIIICLKKRREVEHLSPFDEVLVLLNLSLAGHYNNWNCIPSMKR